MPIWMRTFCNAKVLWHGKNMEAHASHITLHMLYLATKPYSSPLQETKHINTYESPFCCLPSEPLLLFDLVTLTTMWVGAVRVVNYGHFALNKFGRSNNTLNYNALSLIIFSCDFHSSSTKANHCTNFPHIHSVHSQFRHSLVKCLNIESCYSPISQFITWKCFLLISLVNYIYIDNLTKALTSLQ